jgi:hypothetical protein
VGLSILLLAVVRISSTSCLFQFFLLNSSFRGEFNERPSDHLIRFVALAVVGTSSEKCLSDFLRIFAYMCGHTATARAFPCHFGRRRDVIDDERENFGRQSKFGWRTGNIFRFLHFSCLYQLRERSKTFQLKSSKTSGHRWLARGGPKKKKIHQNLIEDSTREEKTICELMKFHSDVAGQQQCHRILHVFVSLSLSSSSRVGFLCNVNDLLKSLSRFCRWQATAASRVQVDKFSSKTKQSMT